jgi:hypothetical protein
MKRMTALRLAATTLMALALTACQSSRTTRLSVHGTPGADFTAHYRSGALEGTVATQAQVQPTTVLEVNGGRFEAEVVKKDSAAELTVEVRRGSRTVFQAFSPHGSLGLRLAEKSGGWATEQIP